MDIEQLKALALADDRDAALSALVAGTEDHDYWRAIRLQHQGKLTEVDAILDGWRSKHGDTTRRGVIERRQLLLRADADLAANAQRLADDLGVRHDHQPELEAEAARYPSRLPPILLDPTRLLDQALQRPRGLGAVTDAALPHLLARPLDAARRRELLERLGRVGRTGLPGLIGAIAADLGEKSSKGFGSLAIHHGLTRAELDDLATRVPRLRKDRAWIEASLVRLRPPDHVDWEHDLIARIAYLDALWAEVAALPDVFNSLKAHVLYHRLACDLRADTLDRARLLAYLALPRRATYVRATWITKLEHAVVAGLDHDFSAVTGLPVVADDEEVIRPYLAHFLTGEDGRAFADHVEGGWLDRLLAETRLLAGDPDVERWTTILGAAAATALRDRVDLDLLPTNPRRFGAGDRVALDVAVKNAGALRVRVFRINTVAYFQARGGDVDLGLDLDGLAAGWEEVRPATHPPMRRVRERIELPACDRPGTYVVELIGNGRASRALIRKGDLRATTRPSPAGVAVTILDEAGQARPGAWVWLGGRDHRPREDGTITLPFSTRPGPQPALLIDGDVAVVTTIDLPGEAYALTATTVLDRQAMVPGQDATVLVRPSLTVGGEATTLALLEDAYAEITAVDRAGVPARRRQPLTLADDQDVALTVAVPEHLARLTLAIGGRVRVVSEQRTIDLRHEVGFDVGTMHARQATEALYLTRSAEGWSLSLLGKSGEPRPGRAVALQLTPELLMWSVDVTLATDERGVIELGELPRRLRLRATTSTGLDQTFALDAPAPVTATTIHVREGDELTVPVPPDIAPLDGWIVEHRAGVPAYDHTALGRLEPGLLRVHGLPPGEHRIGTGVEVVTVRVVPAAAPVARGWATLPRTLLALPPPAAALGEVTVSAEALTATVVHATARTRVHVVAMPLWSAPATDDDELSGPVRDPAARWLRPRETRYVSGRDIGDEYRYVLDRQHAPRRPGMMLDRPSLLLNPWALRATTTAVQGARGEGGWAASAPAPAGAVAAGAGGYPAEDRRAGDPAFAAYDFLAAPPVVIANLRPDADGRVQVPRAALGAARLVHVMCVDPSATTGRLVPLPLTPLAVRDLRLPAALPADRHLREDRRLAALPAGATLEVADRATSRVELVDSVDKLYRALCALGGDADLAAWDFLPRWAALSRAERLSLYSKHACHELALFIHFKDPELFADVVRPYLANKLVKTFVDRWLLGDDLSGYLASVEMDRLNAFERALLAQRLPSARAALTRQLADAVDLIPPDPEGDDRLVDAFLAGGALSGDGADLGAAAAAEVAEEVEEMKEERRSGAPPKLAKRAARMMAPPPPPAPAALAASLTGSIYDRGLADEAELLDLAARETTAPLYRGAEKTQEWAEHNWWHKRRAEQGPDLIRPARLWRDLAGHAGGPFLSPHLADAAASFAASVCALAVLDLPFVAAPHAITARGAGAAVRAGSNALAALAELSPVAGPPLGQVLVGQSYFRADDRWEWDGAEQREKYVTGEMLIGVVYQRQIVVTNPTSRQQRLAVLLQIPAGAIAVGGGVATRTARIELSPYATTSLEHAFYFPAAGTFAHYGAQVTRGDELVAAGAARAVTVVRAPTEVDTGSWAHVSQRGSLDDVIGYLTARNLGRIDLGKIAWRLRDRAAFERITAALAARHVYDDTVWSYALVHHDRARAAEWLGHQDAWLTDLGPLATGLITVDPVARGNYEHLEYAPLINARAHRLGERRTVLNEGLAAQWRALLELVATRPAPRPDDWLAAAHYAFTMDRPDDGARALARAPRDAVAAGLQHDYLTAYAAAAAGDLTTARARTAPHVDHPVDRWRHRFAAMAAMLDEVAGAAPAAAVTPDARDARMAELAARQPTLAVRVDHGHVVLDHLHLERATIRFYRMDVELLFSRQPFLGAAGDRFAFIDPGASIDVALDAGGRTRVRLPDDLRQANVVIEVVAGALRQAVTHFAHDLAVAVAAPYGQLQVRRASTGAMLPAAYVKAYARLRGGAVQFFKDGYTDLRGRLDYATLSTDDLDRVERFALLVVHDDAGATVLEAEPPTR